MKSPLLNRIYLISLLFATSLTSAQEQKPTMEETVDFLNNFFSSLEDDMVITHTLMEKGVHQLTFTTISNEKLKIVCFLIAFLI